MLYLCIVGSDQADGPRKGATFLPERYYLSRSLQPPFSALLTTTREIINIIVSLFYLFTFLLLIYGTFKHSHDD